MSLPHVVVLGAGPAGVGAAFKLSRSGRARVTVLERNAWVGGNAGSFEISGCRVDFGSHRLHPACAPEILADIRALLGPDLLERPRHGRIRLRNRWIHFPLKPLDLLLRLPPTFALGVARDAARKVVRPRTSASTQPPSFASVLEAGLGPTLCRDFYFPYARKVWGLAPEDLAAAQAERRVSAGSIAKILGKVWSAMPGVRGRRGHSFFYPRGGYGQISEAYGAAAQAAGARVLLGARVLSVDTSGNRVAGVRYEDAHGTHFIAADHVWSTIPVTALVGCLQPGPPPRAVHAAPPLEYRSLILVYLVLQQTQFSEWDAHYFPEADIPISRLSEPKNYSGDGPPGVTVLCAELPCHADGAVWASDDDALGSLVRTALDAAGLPVRAPLKEVVTRRIRYAYPIYRRGYRDDFDRLDAAVDAVDGLLTFGRQGLFAHDNTHHALYTAYSAAACLRADGVFDRERWRRFRQEFETHVVED